MNDILFALLLTSFAGLSTGIGSAIAFIAKYTNTKFLSASLGFSGGVMIFVSMIEIYPNAQSFFERVYDAKVAAGLTALCFFLGMGVIALIDKLIPSQENPHEARMVEDNEKPVGQLMRMGLFTALAIGVHNFPEGMATFVSALQEPTVAIPIVVAIAIHNIPEGIAVSVPIYHATGSKIKAFWFSFLSGLAEPFGALVGWLVLMPFMNDLVFGGLFAAVAGIMVFISIDELLPAAREYGWHHLSVYGFVAGMMVMAVSLILL